MRTICSIRFLGVAFKIRILSNSTLSLRAAKRKTRVTTAWALTVAIAAPATPRTGNGPQPKIKTGSKIILMTRPITLETKGVLLSPQAVKIPVKIAFKKEKMIRPQVMAR